MTNSELKLQQVLQECQQLKKENKKLKELLKRHDHDDAVWTDPL